MPVFEHGCFCCQLETCVKIQGYVCTVGFFLIAILDMVALAVWIVPREQNPGPKADEFDKRFISYTKLVCVVLCICLIIWSLLGGLLLYGIYKKRRLFFWPYMVVAGVNLFITLGLLIFFAASINSQIQNMLVLMVILALQFYFLLHVISLFQKMGDEERQRINLEQQE